MKILLILADGRIHRISIGSFKRSMREAPLTLTTLAALVPEELDARIELVDESVDTVPLGADADIVGISAITGTSKRAYELADHFRRRRVPVVLGGVHVTLMPEEAGRHADAVVIGPAEKTWPRLLRDLRAGSLKEVYRAEERISSPLDIPPPRRDLQKSLRYMVPNTVMATRGCKGSCAFCTVPAVLQGYAKRPVGDVIRDIKSARGNYIVFNDVSLADDVEYAAELFTAMIPLGKRWGGLATVKIVQHPHLMDLMAKSGCRYILVGFESVQQTVLNGIHKGFNRQDEYRTFMERMHAHDISVQGCFVFGFDHDDSTVFEATVQRVIDLKVDIPRFAVLTPYPGTEIFRQLERENRILTRNWENYDTMHVVFQPAKMTVEELHKGFKWAYRETFRLPQVIRRSRSLGLSGIINFVGNINYRRFAVELGRDEMYRKPFAE